MVSGIKCMCVDQGKEWILMLYTQELLADQRRNTSRTAHLQTSSKMVTFVSIIQSLCTCFWWGHFINCFCFSCRTTVLCRAYVGRNQWTSELPSQGLSCDSGREGGHWPRLPPPEILHLVVFYSCCEYWDHFGRSSMERASNTRYSEQIRLD